MEDIQYHSGNPALNPTHLHARDGQRQTNNNNATATPNTLCLLQPPGQLHHSPVDSSPQGKYLPTGPVHADQRHAVYMQSGYTHPPTPPRQEDELPKLLSWNAQDDAEKQTFEYDRQAYHWDVFSPYAHGTSGMSASSLPNAHYQPYHYQPHHYQPHQHHGPDSGLSQQPQCLPYQTQNEFARLVHQVSETAPRRPSTASSSASGTLPPNIYPAAGFTQSQLPIPQPPMQLWPTHTLGQQPRVLLPPQPVRTLSDATLFGPSPGHDGVTPCDVDTLRKQQAFKKSAEEQRQRRRLKMMAPPLRATDSSHAKRKEPPHNYQDSAPTLAPVLRQPPVDQYGLPYNHAPGHFQENYQPSLLTGPQPSLPHPTYSPSHYASSPNESRHVEYAPTLQLPPTGDSITHEPSTPSPLKKRPGRSRKQPALHDSPQVPLPRRRPSKKPAPEDSPQPPSPVPQVPVDWDVYPQDITANYADYKWSVKLYELNPDSGFDFAQSWLEDLFKKNNLKGPNCEWHTHSSQGFIKDGGRLSLIVLHNAAVPFESNAARHTTTSIGVYGRDWHEHEEIHWTTVSPDLIHLLDFCLYNRAIFLKQTWPCDHLRASERRFHRAYWLAARMDPTKDLLKHSDMTDPVHDAIQGEINDGFEINEQDLQNGTSWNNSHSDSHEAWDRVLRQNDEMGTVVSSHVVTGTSGMEMD